MFSIISSLIYKARLVAFSLAFTIMAAFQPSIVPFVPLWAVETLNAIADENFVVHAVVEVLLSSLKAMLSRLFRLVENCVVQVRLTILSFIIDTARPSFTYYISLILSTIVEIAITIVVEHDARSIFFVLVELVKAVLFPRPRRVLSELPMPIEVYRTIAYWVNCQSRSEGVGLWESIQVALVFRSLNLTLKIAVDEEHAWWANIWFESAPEPTPNDPYPSAPHKYVRDIMARIVNKIEEGGQAQLPIHIVLRVLYRDLCSGGLAPFLRLCPRAEGVTFDLRGFDNQPGDHCQPTTSTGLSEVLRTLALESHLDGFHWRSLPPSFLSFRVPSKFVATQRRSLTNFAWTSLSRIQLDVSMIVEDCLRTVKMVEGHIACVSFGSVVGGPYQDVEDIRAPHLWKLELALIRSTPERPIARLSSFFRSPLSFPFLQNLTVKAVSNEDVAGIVNIPTFKRVNQLTMVSFGIHDGYNLIRKAPHTRTLTWSIPSPPINILPVYGFNVRVDSIQVVNLELPSSIADESWSIMGQQGLQVTRGSISNLSIKIRQGWQLQSVVFKPEFAPTDTFSLEGIPTTVADASILPKVLNAGLTPTIIWNGDSESEWGAIQRAAEQVACPTTRKRTATRPRSAFD